MPSLIWLVFCLSVLERIFIISFAFENAVRYRWRLKGPRNARQIMFINTTYISSAGKTGTLIYYPQQFLW